MILHDHDGSKKFYAKSYLKLHEAILIVREMDSDIDQLFTRICYTANMVSHIKCYVDEESHSEICLAAEKEQNSILEDVPKSNPIREPHRAIDIEPSTPTQWRAVPYVSTSTKKDGE